MPGIFMFRRCLIQSMGIQERCRLHDCLISDAPFKPETFDLITSISVIEHIPDDRSAVQKMWSLLKPQGHLWITVPCSSKSSEQYIDRDEYGILSPAESGFFFWQRFYDSQALEDRIFTLTGPPSRRAVYGEKMRDFSKKRSIQEGKPLLPVVERTLHDGP